MKVDGKYYRSIWLADDGWSVGIIDQTELPHQFTTRRLRTLEEAAEAIASMRVRGAPLIGATAAYGVCIGLRDEASDDALRNARRRLLATRPTAVNLRWALDLMERTLAPLPAGERPAAAYAAAARICDEDVDTCRAIAVHGARLIAEAWEKQGGKGAVEVLTHCNAGWLATVDWGTALAGIYLAHDRGVPVHVWVGETRPRNQGAAITAWELARHGVPHTVIVDNAGGHLMQRGRVGMCLVGSDRTTATGNVCNKIGTYLKALAAADNGIPFYVAVPFSSIDWAAGDSPNEIPIEERDPDEVTRVAGRASDGTRRVVTLTPPDSPALNYGFDVTPARLVSGLITERGVCPASREGLSKLYPESDRRTESVSPRMGD